MDNNNLFQIFRYFIDNEFLPLDDRKGFITIQNLMDRFNWMTQTEVVEIVEYLDSHSMLNFIRQETTLLGYRWFDGWSFPPR
jgi:hypothetical protein